MLFPLCGQLNRKQARIGTITENENMRMNKLDLPSVLLQCLSARIFQALECTTPAIFACAFRTGQNAPHHHRGGASAALPLSISARNSDRQQMFLAQYIGVQ
jgi:hypothetical protein